jgi:chromosome segregation ATPase
MRAEMDKQIASTLQSIEQLKAKQAHYQTALKQASKQLELLHISFDHHLAHIQQQLNTITHATAKRDQLLQETQAQKSILSSTKRELDALRSQVTNKKFKYALQNLEAKYKKANQRQDRLQEQLEYLQDKQNTVWHGNIQEVERQTNHYEKVLEKVVSDVHQLVEETEKLSNKIGNLPDQNQLLGLANQRLTTTLKTMQEELATLRTHFAQQQRAYQPANLEKQAITSEGLEQKQALYTQAKRAYQEAQQALSEHIEHLWSIYHQHNPPQPTLDIKALNAFMRQHSPQEMELFRKKREQRNLTQARYEAIKKELKALTKEMDKLQLAAALANNTEESIDQLWKTYTSGDDTEKFWQAYEQRLQTLDGWRQAVYLFK